MFNKDMFSFSLEVPDRIGESSGKNDGEILYLWNTIHILFVVTICITFYFT